MKVKVKVWIEDDDQNLIFGSGKTEVLENVDRTGSIAEAAKEVGMNYKKAWSHIKILEKFIEEDLVMTFKGRGENSGTSLTPKAREVIQTYKILEHDIKKYAEDRYKELFVKGGEEILNPKEDK
ncbi:winged helix-turn-helix domain-containing protein [Arcobacter sp. CECT 8985]|uniref:winged helix-turn-helix domain-containing protein n=1 Tax=Arcobacter sp. CECT 8985 TaxID=1935424 RepID=UPI00100A8E0E|nr:LysR family transcriptional regulator [Arcobacter sp. CECT 8985]RXJ88249.1 molybdenum transporter [Arcobacter sp. CECT 8985]